MITSTEEKSKMYLDKEVEIYLDKEKEIKLVLIRNRRRCRI